MDPTRAQSRAIDAATAAHGGIPADDWRTCSHIFTEGRRIRALAAELRDQLARGVDETTRTVIEQYVQSLDRAASLGDVVAHCLVARYD